MTSLTKILNYALQSAMDMADEDGEVNLTAVEEDVRIQFDLDDQEFDDRDLSFKIFSHLEAKGFAGS